MSLRNLLEAPYWCAKDLGQAIPDSPHAVSVALPRWEDVIAYEEKDPSCIKSLKAIYPRFGLNPLVAEFADKVSIENNLKNCTVWPYPTISSAQKAKTYCQQTIPNGHLEISDVLGLKCLIADEESTSAAKAFWQHTGVGASSRIAAIALGKEKAPSSNSGESSREIIRQRLAQIYSCKSSNIELHPSGMAALARALEAITQLNPNQQTLQVGFPYVDVLKLPKVIYGGGNLLLKTEINDIAAELERRKPSAIIVELPSNPMLQCVDLISISRLAHEKGIPVIADDTIGSALNINTLQYADIVFSSLTKSFAGRGDILAGSLVISPQSRWEKIFIELLSRPSSSPLADPDAIELEKASRDVHQRLPLLNKACLTLSNRLENHPSVQRVLHPKSCSNFKSLMNPDGGYGCLLSFEIVDGATRAQKFYDNLKVCKGPSLGTNFTLVCPYVLLAHYNELNWAEECGVPRHLIRVSVGLEDPADLWERFQYAFSN